MSPTVTTEPGRTRPRVLSLLGAQIKAELRSAARVPEYVIGTVGIPVLLFAMFGLTQVDQPAGDGDVSVGALMVASMLSYGIVSLAIFSFGAEVAQDRGKGWLRRLRATPMPMWAYFAGKLVAAVVFALLICGLIFLLAVGPGKLRFSAAEVTGLVAVMVLGTLAFAPFGFAIAYWFKPKAAVAIANLIFLPLAFVSGYFFPRAELPDVLSGIAPWLPTYYFGQLAWSRVGGPDDYAYFVRADADPLWQCLLWVVGAFVVFSTLAVWGYQRDLRRDNVV